MGNIDTQSLYIMDTHNMKCYKLLCFDIKTENIIAVDTNIEYGAIFHPKIRQ